jgi:hypothetical protein
MNRRIKCAALTAVAIAAITASAGALAAEPEARGFYVGAMGGATGFDDDGACGGCRYDDSDSGYGVYAGYKILKYLAIEARYQDVGFDTEEYSGHVIGIVPFAQSGWEIFGQLGAGTLDFGRFGNETSYSGGLGVRFYPMPHLGLSLQTDVYMWEEGDDAPNFGATQVAVHWLF